uniref:Uncharacterized protein n=1 Tax=Ornithorhynchus anatinus TaxID=9258 RepID=A0A6I8PFD2_ORNAN
TTATAVPTGRTKGREKSGKSELLRLGRTLSENESHENLSFGEIQQALYEPAFHVIKGILKHDRTSNVLCDITAFRDDTPSILADVVCRFHSIVSIERLLCAEHCTKDCLSLMLNCTF